MIVADASVIATFLLDDEAAGARVRERLRRERLVAPEIVDLEVLSVIRRTAARGQATERRADQAVADLRDLRLERLAHRPFVDRCWELRHHVTPYDAAYVAVAEALGAPLVTADARLAAAPGIRCELELLR
jgi:predicted nucleic acid-binding protein